MLDFAIFGLPRSGTTWAANWLTTDKTICLHDPLNNLFVDDLEKLSYEGKLTGVSCTGLWRLTDWCEKNIKHIAVIDHDTLAINESLAEMGLRALDQDDVSAFRSLPFRRFNFSDLFDATKAAELWRFLIGEGFDAERHQLLREMNIQPHFQHIDPNPDIVHDYVKRLQGGAA